MIRVRQMTAADLSLGLRLSRQAGWNQTEADWRRILFLQPDGCFLAEWQGTPAATTVVIVFGSVAWVAMVLVEETVRGRGIGTALLDHALAFLDRSRVPSVRLDATPQGHSLYERLGFVEQFRLARYGGVLPPAADAAEATEVPAEQWEALAALDETVTGMNRRRLLLRLFAEQPAGVRCVRRGRGLEGFLAARPGHQAFQLGPCLASPSAGPLLLADAWRRYAGQAVFLDIPVTNEAATRWAEARGLAAQRHLTRMCRGVPQCERVEWLWASSGPEKG
ncbi:MAG TPA: GNAT family N-acetyltransferase [Gemmataceae bacterium]|jgi:GNAT superfamily N-acetyltransferase